MAKEYFDILDENGNKTGEKKLRSEVHRDGDWHRAVHIWIVNNNGDVLLQRRSANKDSNPNMIDISSAGHLSAGDNSIDAACREIKEELSLDVKKEDLVFIKTIKSSTQYTETFINNEFDDLYVLRTNKKLEDMKYQEEEISEIMYVPYKKLKEMYYNHQPDLLRRHEEDEDYIELFKIFDEVFDK